MSEVLRRGIDSSGRLRPVRRLPRILRCCGYRAPRTERWVGYCLELHLREEGRDWDELLERLMLACSMRLAHLAADPSLPVPGRAPLAMRLRYAYIALRHFLRPGPERCLADLSSALLLEGGPPR